MDRETRMGPVVSREQFDRVRAYQEIGKGEAKTAMGGGQARGGALDAGYFIEPTIFYDVDNRTRIAREEIFGPVASVIPFDDEREALSIANDTDYGLAGGVWSGDPERAKAVARRLRTGQVEVNGGSFNPAAPFGGYKQSGNGREFGSFGLEEFLEVKAMQL